MARTPNLEKLSYADLIELRGEVDALIAERHETGKSELKAKLADMARAQGFELDEVLGRRTGRNGKSKVAVKYRDENGNAWTGRGRMPRWMTAALKTRGVKKDDFLVD